MNWATHTISLSNRDGQFYCNEQKSLLHGLESQRIKAVQAGCRGGGCGVCKIRVLSGEFFSKKMSKKHVSADEFNQGMGLSCRIFPRSDMVIEALD